MTAPLIVVLIAEAYALVKTLGTRITLIDEQAYGRHVQLSAALDYGFEQRGGYALTAERFGHGKTVYVELAGLRLVGHSAVVDAECP